MELGNSQHRSSANWYGDFDYCEIGTSNNREFYVTKSECFVRERLLMEIEEVGSIITENYSEIFKNTVHIWIVQLICRYELWKRVRDDGIEN